MESACVKGGGIRKCEGVAELHAVCTSSGRGIRPRVACRSEDEKGHLNANPAHPHGDAPSGMRREGVGWGFQHPPPRALPGVVEGFRGIQCRLRGSRDGKKWFMRVSIDLGLCCSSRVFFFIAVRCVSCVR